MRSGDNSSLAHSAGNPQQNPLNFPRNLASSQNLNSSPWKDEYDTQPNLYPLGLKLPSHQESNPAKNSFLQGENIPSGLHEHSAISTHSYHHYPPSSSNLTPIQNPWNPAVNPPRRKTAQRRSKRYNRRRRSEQRIRDRGMSHWR